MMKFSVPTPPAGGQGVPFGASEKLRQDGVDVRGLLGHERFEHVVLSGCGVGPVRLELGQDWLLAGSLVVGLVVHRAATIRRRCATVWDSGLPLNPTEG